MNVWKGSVKKLDKGVGRGEKMGGDSVGVYYVRVGNDQRTNLINKNKKKTLQLGLKEVGDFGSHNRSWRVLFLFLAPLKSSSATHSVSEISHFLVSSLHHTG